MRLSLMACLLTSALLLPSLVVAQSASAPPPGPGEATFYAHTVATQDVGWINTLPDDGEPDTPLYLFPEATIDLIATTIGPVVLEGTRVELPLDPGLTQGLQLDPDGMIEIQAHIGGGASTVALVDVTMHIMAGNTTIATVEESQSILVPAQVNGDVYNLFSWSVAPLVTEIPAETGLTWVVEVSGTVGNNIFMSTYEGRGRSFFTLPITGFYTPPGGGDGGAGGSGDDDTDGDGLPDQWEQDNFGNLDQNGTGDPDADGCDNACEFANGTDPNDADTDGGGVNDGDEIANGTDPNDPTDDVVGGVDPDDTDGDGLADAWEIEHFGDLSQDGTGDPDDDGCDNECEETAGTDPNDADTDKDGVSDGDEIRDGTDPLDPDDPGSGDDGTDAGAGGDDTGSGGSDSDDKTVLEKLEASSGYVLASLALMLLVLVLAIIGLAGRWSS